MTIYSHSRLGCFEKCPKQFHYRYVLEVPAETEGIEAFMGKRVHEVLERLYEFTGKGMVPSIEKVLHRYNAFWDEHYDEKRVVIVKKKFPASHYRKLGEKCIENYYRRHFPFDRDETLGIEETVHFNLDEAGEYKVRGIIDRIVRARDGAIEIQDYKTGRYVPPQQQLDEDRQLALYQIGLSERFPDEPVRLIWHYLQSGQIRSSQRNPDQLDELKTQTCRLIDRIEATEEFPARKSQLCDWCAYKEPCFASAK
jgi:putative RecB family exonuclease